MGWHLSIFINAGPAQAPASISLTGSLFLVHLHIAVVRVMYNKPWIGPQVFLFTPGQPTPEPPHGRVWAAFISLYMAMHARWCATSHEYMSLLIFLLHTPADTPTSIWAIDCLFLISFPKTVRGGICNKHKVCNSLVRFYARPADTHFLYKGSTFDSLAHGWVFEVMYNKPYDLDT